jgi:hypothetical protein
MKILDYAIRAGSVPLAGFVFLCPMSVEAVSIPVPNSGFESPVLADGIMQFGDFSGWTVTSFFTDGVLNPAAAQLPGGAPEGQNVLVGTGRSGPLSLLDVGTYTLTYEVGYQLGYGGGSVNAVAVSAGFDGIATANGPQPTAGTMATASLAFTVPAGHARLGQALRIAFGSAGATAYFDNVKLDFTPATTSVPEAGSTLGLAVLGFLATAGVRSRFSRPRATQEIEI